MPFLDGGGHVGRLQADAAAAKYVKMQMVGQGSYGQVFLVKYKPTNAIYVMKSVSLSGMAREARKEALQEATMLQRLDHPNIIKYIESFERANALLIVTEYAAKGDLHKLISSRKGRRFTENVVLDWFVQISLALKYLHERHILHRDIKTSNIFLSDKGVIKLGDFGISKVLVHTMQFARTAVGTPYYMSPELCLERPYNNRSDVWALGCVLYELTTLRHAFEANSMKALVAEILRGRYRPLPPEYSSGLKELVASMLQREPMRRPAMTQILQLPIVTARIRAFLEGNATTNEAETPSKTPLKQPPPGPPLPRKAGVDGWVSAQQKEPPSALPQLAKPVPVQRIELCRYCGKRVDSNECCRAKADNRRVGVPEAVMRAQQRAHAHREKQRVVEQEQREQAKARLHKAQEEQRERLRKGAVAAQQHQRRAEPRKLPAPMPGRSPAPSDQGKGAGPQRVLDQHYQRLHELERENQKREEVLKARAGDFRPAPPPKPRKLPPVLPAIGRDLPVVPSAPPLPSEPQPSPPPSENIFDAFEEKHGTVVIGMENEAPTEALKETMRQALNMDDDEKEAGQVVFEEKPGVTCDPTKKFQVNGATYKLPNTTASDSLSYRVEMLRMHLEEELGPSRLVQVHRLLQSSHNDDQGGEMAVNRAKGILGSRFESFLPLVYQLIFCEEVLDKQNNA